MFCHSYTRICVLKVAPYCQGILPDLMHISHLALVPDCIISCLLDWTDNTKYFAESSREKRLDALWHSYKNWCEGQKVQDRASKRLFSAAVLKPDVAGYTEVSQKIINATAARYMLFWLSSVAKQLAASGDEIDQCFGKIKTDTMGIHYIPPSNPHEKYRGVW